MLGYEPERYAQEYAGEREIDACVRYDIRRRATQVRGELVFVRKTVLGADGKTERREYRRAFACHFH